MRSSWKRISHTTKQKKKKKKKKKTKKEKNEKRETEKKKKKKKKKPKKKTQKKKKVDLGRGGKIHQATGITAGTGRGGPRKKKISYMKRGVEKKKALQQERSSETENQTRELKKIGKGLQHLVKKRGRFFFEVQQAHEAGGGGGQEKLRKSHTVRKAQLLFCEKVKKERTGPFRERTRMVRGQKKRSGGSEGVQNGKKKEAQQRRI